MPAMCSFVFEWRCTTIPLATFSRARRKILENIFKLALSSELGLLGWDPSS